MERLEPSASCSVCGYHDIRNWILFRALYPIVGAQKFKEVHQEVLISIPGLVVRQRPVTVYENAFSSYM